MRVLLAPPPDGGFFVGRVRLIDNWRQAHRFWSVLLTLGGFVCEAADLLLGIFNAIPDGVAAYIPPHTLSVVGLALLLLSIPARLIRQAKLHGE